MLLGRGAVLGRLSESSQDMTHAPKPVCWVSKIGGPQYRPQNTMVLIMGTSKLVLLISEHPRLCSDEAFVLGQHLATCAKVGKYSELIKGDILGL